MRSVTSASIYAELQDIEARISKLERSRRFSTASITNGQVRVLTDQGATRAEFGMLSNDYHATNQDVYGMTVLRDNGSPMLSVSSLGLYRPYQLIPVAAQSIAEVTYYGPNGTDASTDYLTYNTITFDCSASHLAIDIYANLIAGSGALGLRLLAGLSEATATTNIFEETGITTDLSHHTSTIDLTSFSGLGGAEVVGSRVWINVQGKVPDTSTQWNIFHWRDPYNFVSQT